MTQAGTVLNETVNHTEPLRALVIGAGISGLITARALAESGIDVTLVGDDSDPESPLFSPSPEFDRAEIRRTAETALQGLNVRRVTSVTNVQRRGPVFTAMLGPEHPTEFGCVFLTGSAKEKPLPEGLPADTEVLSPDTTVDAGQSIAFVLDYAFPSDPAAGMSAVEKALKHTEAGGRSVVLFRHMPVVHTFGESMYENAKRAGVGFYRFGEEQPAVEKTADGYRISLVDRVEEAEPIDLNVDRIILAGALDCADLSESSAKLIDDDVDGRGFALSESIHCAGGKSFRNAVFSVGEATGNSDLIRITGQAYCAAVEARAWMLGRAERMERTTVSVADTCIRCLTCYRLCPHNAVTFTAGTARSRVEASPVLCEECGICVSECPRNALDLTAFPDAGLASFLDDVRAAKPADTVVVYGCSRSPGRAVRGAEFPPEAVFLSVKCAGLISESVIWSTLAVGVKGVLVVGCHHQNCASESGTDWAGIHVAEVKKALDLPQGVPTPVEYFTCAANESVRLTELVTRYCESLRT